MDKKGFLFTVTVFLILTYILLSISVWVKGVEASERAYSEFYKESNVELAVEQITPERIDNVTNVLMDRSIYRLNKQAAIEALRPKPGVSENENLRQTVFELFMYGNASGSHFELAQPVPTEQSSFTLWATNLNSTLNAIGVYISAFNVSDFQVGQSSMNEVNYSFIVDLNISDYSTSSMVSRRYNISNSVDISGLPDPALARESLKLTGDPSAEIYRQFFFNSAYPNAGSIEGVKTIVPQSGMNSSQGWVYGYLATAKGSSLTVPNGNDVLPTLRRNYILVGNYEDIITIPQYDSFGGFIVLDKPTFTASICGSNPGTLYDELDTFNPVEYTGNKCDAVKGSQGTWTMIPFAIAIGFDASTAPECPLLWDLKSKGRCVMITSPNTPKAVSTDPTQKFGNSGAAILDVEGIRDFVMCGYYTQDPNGASYLQHLMNNTYLRSDPVNGISTFVIGEYANSTSYDTRSRLDRELFAQGAQSGTKIRGLPGCRDFESCASSPAVSTGVFAVSDTTMTLFNLGKIACPQGSSASGVCEQ